LRMSTTGLAAQSFGAKHAHQLGLVFTQGMVMALGFAGVFLLLHSWIGDWVFAFSDASTEVKHYGLQYFSIRVIGYAKCESANVDGDHYQPH